MKFFAAVFAALVAAVSANNHDECVCVSEATFEAHGFHTARDIVQKVQREKKRKKKVITGTIDKNII
jgi:hypothetical protein